MMSFLPMKRLRHQWPILDMEKRGGKVEQETWYHCCILSGKLVWAVRIDIHMLDNGGRVGCESTAKLRREFPIQDLRYFILSIY
ncbi:hypothetical protein QN277_026137 [Acacia crassicarpa]|uniref:Uncharacterized protein n=1 Tax=Acacia crassicarpa TaxID=499986 RepID=A0AAE1J6Z8_9FABA|nr:hypothetical protein QN277_026137 [Acacia crassicarpa]